MQNLKFEKELFEIRQSYENKYNNNNNNINFDDLKLKINMLDNIIKDSENNNKEIINKIELFEVKQNLINENNIKNIENNRFFFLKD